MDGSEAARAARRKVEGMVRSDRDLSPKDIARLDKGEYEEPGRDLMATKPAQGMGAGAVGDVDNPVASEHSHGLSDPDEGKLGSDEVNRLARRKS